MASINGQLIQALAPTSTETLAISSTAAPTTVAFDKKMVRLLCTVDCFVHFATTATVANGMPLVSGVPEYFPLNGASTISAITSSASGTLYISQMN